MDSDSLIVERLKLEGAGRRWSRVAGLVGAAGLAASVALLPFVAHGRELFFRAYLVNLMFYLSLALGGLFFVLVTHLTRAGWSVALRRVAEVCAWTVLPLSAATVVLLFGLHDLYEWTHADAVAGDPLLQHKQPYLKTGFFVARLAAYFLVWNLMALFFLRRSLSQDESGDPRITVQLEKAAAPGTIVYAMSVSFAAIDLMMTLYPHWYSTIFGVYFFAGCVVGFFSLVTLLLGALQRSGRMLRVVTTAHYHDLGKLIFAFVVFWAYIAFSQYFLIWFGNIPEETAWYKLRQTGPWTGLSLLLLFGHFVFPFLLLMSRHPKRRRPVLLAAAGWLLVMHWCDMLYLVMPEGRPAGPLLHWLDVTCFVGLGGLFLAAVLWRLERVNLIPLRDPRLAESLGFENA